MAHRAGCGSTALTPTVPLAQIARAATGRTALALIAPPPNAPNVLVRAGRTAPEMTAPATIAARNGPAASSAASPAVLIARAVGGAVRIVGGKFRGHPLVGPREGDLSIRPTSDRLRESLFNILQHRFDRVLDDARVIDLFAGTGALGFEAMSRGAKTCLFVEESAAARGIIRGNQEALGLTGATRIFRRDATGLGTVGTAEPYTLAFLDPPYGKGLGTRALASLVAGGWLAPGALVVVEESARAELQFPPAFAVEDEREFGDTVIRIARMG